MELEIDLRALTDGAAIAESIAYTVVSWRSDDGNIDGRAGTAGAAMIFGGNLAAEFLSVEEWGGIAGVPLPLTVEPRCVRAHLRRVIAIDSGQQGRN